MLGQMFTFAVTRSVCKLVSLFFTHNFVLSFVDNAFIRVSYDY